MNLTRIIRTYFPFLLLLVFIFSFLGSDALAAASPIPKQVKNDTLKRTERSLDPQAEKELLSDPDYKYDRKEGPEPLSAWDKFWDWLFRKLGDASETKQGAIGIDVLYYLLLGGAIIAVILLLLKNNIRS
nr:hypothetical protein [Bacteroidota bacterium]